MTTKHTLISVIIGLSVSSATSTCISQTYPAYHPSIGTTVYTADSTLRITLTDKIQHFSINGGGEFDADINSPKSANIHPNGRKFYINSLEGCKTIAYDMESKRKLKVISHRFTEADSALFSKPCGLFPFRFYKNNLNTFNGKPVEGAFSHGGRYFWVPFYRRTFDLNAQEPSAMAIIDTEKDSTVLVMETGPLPKMVCASHDGKYMVVSHWGDNTVGLIDIRSSNPHDWKYLRYYEIDKKLILNFSLTESVDRDQSDGWLLRGTTFTPDDHYLLVGCMGNSGGIAVIDMTTHTYLGRMQGMRSNVRHLVINDGWLYLSINRTGYVQRIRLDRFLQAASKMENHIGSVDGWEDCKVGDGARTIELSPDGRYVFAACNIDSKICIVDTRTMQEIANIQADSYPVGLDISQDGKTVITTSQGRGNQGGNAVDIYQIEREE